MIPTTDTPPPGPRGHAQFTTTHWSVVLAARQTDTPAASAALEQLCQIYWHPLYAFVCRNGYDEESAKDLTQGFFEYFLERYSLARFRRTETKFRSFLLVSLKHFLKTERDRANAQKRGGGKIIVSFEALTDADRGRLAPVDKMDPEKLFFRDWAETVIATARQRLREEFCNRGKLERYMHLEVYLSGDKNGPPYEEIAGQLGLSVRNVTSEVHRMRKRFGELVRAEVFKTVSSAGEVEDEIRDLFTVVRG